MRQSFSFQEIWNSVSAAAPDGATEMEIYREVGRIWDAQQASNHPYSYAEESSAQATVDEPETVIVSRHAGTVDWLARQGIVGPVFAEVQADQVSGRTVIGNLPMHLAACAAQVGIVEFSGLGRGRQGRDLTPEEMDAAGACIRWYVVEAI